MTNKATKVAANQAVSKAIRNGLMNRPATCEACGFDGASSTRTAWPIVNHHWSYLEEHWLDVIPLCGSCHALVHRGKLVEPRTGRVYPERKHVGIGSVEVQISKRHLAIADEIAEAVGETRSTFMRKVLCRGLEARMSVHQKRHRK